MGSPKKKLREELKLRLMRPKGHAHRVLVYLPPKRARSSMKLARFIVSALHRVLEVRLAEAPSAGAQRSLCFYILLPSAAEECVGRVLGHASERGVFGDMALACVLGRWALRLTLEDVCSWGLARAYERVGLMRVGEA